MLRSRATGRSRVARWGGRLRALPFWAVVVALLSLAAPAPAVETRLRVVLVLDASGSMAAMDPQKIVRLAAKMISDLADERDELTVISFGSEVKTLATGRGDEHDRLRGAISSLGQNENCTDYAIALEAAANALAGKPAAGERRVVLFLTDGRFEPALPNGSCERYEGAAPDVRRPVEERAEQAAQRMKQAGARLFTVGLGAAPSRSADSKALLERVASIGGGRFVHAMGPRDVPPIFASIFGALVGAPVEQGALGPERQEVSFEVPGGADRVHVVLVGDQARDLEGVSLSHDGKAVSLEPTRQETPSSAYRLARVVGEAAGRYRVTGSPRGNVAVLLVPDVGISVRIEGVPPVLPEGEPLKAKVALRTRAGQPVKLAPTFLEDVRFEISLADAKLFDQRPDAEGVAAVTSGALARGRHTLRATVSHRFGFLDLAPVEAQFAVEPRFTLGLDAKPIEFDTMAEEGLVPLKAPATVTVTAPDPLPIEMRLSLEVPDAYAAILSFEPTEIVFTPGGPRSVELELRLIEPEALRGTDQRFEEPLRLVAQPDDAKLLVGDRSWSIPVDARLRSWTWKRYLEEYKTELIAALLVLLLLVYIVGRVVAARFPPKARIHYVEVGQEFESDSLIKRHARHGAYRSAKFQFPLGKKARPLAVFRSTGAGFQVLPAEGKRVTIVDDAVPEIDRERHKPFSGRWEQRYRLDDRYEVWLTRS